MGRNKAKPDIKKCEKCGRIFWVGGRGRPRRGTKFCSKTCGNVETRTRETAKRMTVTQAAYLAAIVDGEGSVVCTRHRPRTSWRVVVVNTDLDLLKWCIRATGVGSINKKQYSTDLKRNFTCYTWNCYSKKAASVLEQIIPYMILKKDKAQLAFDEITQQQKEIAEGRRRHGRYAIT